MPRIALCLALTALAAAAPAGLLGEGIQLETGEGPVPVSGFVFNEEGEAVEGAVVILDIRGPEGSQYWLGEVTPEDGHFFFLVPEGNFHLKCYYSGHLIQRLGYRYGIGLKRDQPRAYHLYLDSFIAARDPGSPVLPTPAAATPVVEPRPVIEPTPIVEPTPVIEEPEVVETIALPEPVAVTPTPDVVPLPLHLHLGAGRPFIGDVAVGFALHQGGYLNLAATLVYVERPEEHLARTGDPALSLDYDLYLGGTLRAHIGVGTGVFFRSDQTLFTVKVKAGLAVFISPNWAVTLGADYYPVIGEVYFGKTLNPRIGAELFF